MSSTTERHQPSTWTLKYPLCKNYILGHGTVMGHLTTKTNQLKRKNTQNSKTSFLGEGPYWNMLKSCQFAPVFRGFIQYWVELPKNTKHRAQVDQDFKIHKWTNNIHIMSRKKESKLAPNAQIPGGMWQWSSMSGREVTVSMLCSHWSAIQDSNGLSARNTYLQGCTPQSDWEWYCGGNLSQFMWTAFVGS